MSTEPASLVELEAFWISQDGTPLGIVGNQKHCSGYHLGRDRIFGQCACRPDGTCEPGKAGKDYSVVMARDRAGLSNAASAIDLGKLGGSLKNLYKFSNWLVAQCQAGKPGSKDIREIIYSPDGVRVQRYSGVDGKIHTGAGNGDGSHIGHTHISYYRDSEKRDKRPLFAEYFELPDTDVEEIMRTFTFTAEAVDGTFTSDGKPGHKYLRLKDNSLHTFPEPFVKHGFGPVTLDGGGITGPADTRNRGYVVGEEAAFVIVADGTFTPATSTDTKHQVQLLVDGKPAGTPVTV